MSEPQYTISRPSVVSLYIEPVTKGVVLSCGTGFTVQRDDVPYLVTNFHVVSGRRPDTGATLDPMGRWPDALSIMHNAQAKLGKWIPMVEPLYDGNGIPLWLEHPVHASQVDVVALPLTNLSDVQLETYDPWAATRGRMSMAGSLSVIGFPFGFAYAGSLATWVQGFVASEPQLDADGLPRFLIDSRTRPGQSGSPVILFNDTGVSVGVRGGIGVGVGLVEDFIGVYSGRINADSDLGYVWKASALRDIIEGQVRGTATAP